MGVFKFFQGVRVKVASDAGYAFKLAFMVGFVLTLIATLLALGFAYWSLSKSDESKPETERRSTGEKWKRSGKIALTVFLIGMLGTLVWAVYLSARAKKIDVQEEMLDDMSIDQKLLYMSERTAKKSTGGGPLRL